MLALALSCAVHAAAALPEAPAPALTPVEEPVASPAPHPIGVDAIPAPYVLPTPWPVPNFKDPKMLAWFQALAAARFYTTSWMMWNGWMAWAAWHKSLKGSGKTPIGEAVKAPTEVATAVMTAPFTVGATITNAIAGKTSTPADDDVAQEEDEEDIESEDESEVPDDSSAEEVTETDEERHITAEQVELDAELEAEERKLQKEVQRMRKMKSDAADYEDAEDGGRAPSSRRAKAIPMWKGPKGKRR